MFVYSVSTVKTIVTNFFVFVFHDLISSVIVQKLVSMRDKKIQFNVIHSAVQRSNLISARVGSLCSLHHTVTYVGERPL